MDKKFIGLDDAAELLGVSKDQLNEIREAGKVRAYRDGASWKFRSEDVDKLKAEGLPAPESDIGLAPMGLEQDSIEMEATAAASPTVHDDADDLAIEDLDLSDLEISSGIGASAEAAPDTSSEAGGSDADLAAVEEPTVAADEPDDLSLDSGEDLVLDAEASGDDAESILLSEAEFGDSTRPPSTIIGKAELANADDDLELAASDSNAPAAQSDVRLADDGADVLSGESADSQVLPGGSDAPSGKFEDLEELEIDLEAESSRILAAEDVAAAQAAQQQAKAPAGSGPDSDLSLAASESGDDLSGLSSLSSDAGAPGDSLTGISSLDIDDGSGSSNLAGMSAIELADDEDDDFVLGDSGSDITLSGGDSGINLAPSDSGLSLEDASQILGGSAIGSSLDLGSGFSNISASGESQAEMSGDLASSEDFLLTPIGDDDGDDEEDSSQIISIEAVEAEDESEDALLGGAVALGGAEVEASGAAPSQALVPEAAFSVWNVVGLGACLMTLIVCGIMMVDITRSIWAWEEPTTTSSAMIDGLLGIFGK